MIGFVENIGMMMIGQYLVHTCTPYRYTYIGGVLVVLGAAEPRDGVPRLLRQRSDCLLIAQLRTKERRDEGGGRPWNGLKYGVWTPRTTQRHQTQQEQQKQRHHQHQNQQTNKQTNEQTNTHLEQ